MKAKDLITRYSMDEHPENGVFIEKHYVSDKKGRADSGSMYYYVDPGEITSFHRIDCDEYWIYNAGSDIELWSFTPEGKLKKQMLGVLEGSEPMVYLKSGEIFASRLSKDNDDGTFITCITVPRFSYQGFEMFEKEEMIKLYPESEEFWMCP